MSIFDEDDDQNDFNNWLNSSPITPNKPIISPPQPKLFTTIEYEQDKPKPVKVKKPKYDSDGNEIEDDGYRNPGGGDGRPVSLDPASSNILIRITPSDHKKYLALGGARWMKKLLKEAKLPVQ